MKNKMIFRIVLDAIMLALLIVSAYIQIPTGLVPFTLQLLVVFLLCIILKPLDAFLVCLLYVIIGLCGLPVFSGFTSGLGKVFALSFGFMIGWIIQAAPCSALYRKLKKTFNFKAKEHVAALISSIMGWIICYGFGFLYIVFLMYVLKATTNSEGVYYAWSVGKILTTCITIFIPFYV